MTTTEISVIQHPFLRGLSADHLQTLSECAMPVRFVAGELIFREGEPANRFYLIQQGKVAIVAPDGEVDPAIIQFVGSGDVLGWSWLFPPYYWHFDARAMESTKAVFFYGTWLRERCEADHHLGYELMKRTAQVVIQRLQAARRQVQELSKSDRIFQPFPALKLLNPQNPKPKEKS